MMIHRLFVGSYFLLPVLAVGLSAGLSSPWPGLAVLAPGIALFVLHQRHLSRALSRLHSRASEGPYAGEGPIYDQLQGRLTDLDERLQETSLRLVNTNIQLLSVRELWQALAQPGKLDHIVDGALTYCHRASGFQEVMILRIEPRTAEIAGRWLHPGKSGTVAEGLRWSLTGVGGILARILRSPRTVLVENAHRQPLVSINGEVPGALAEHESYLAVPLLTPLPRQECIEGGWLYHHDCPAFTPANISDSRSSGSASDDGLDLSPCISCRHYPLYGLMIVTDRGRDGGIRKSDQLTLESLSYAVAAVLQNASLYRDVKGAERFRDQILDGMTNGLITTDDRGRVVFANHQAQQLLGKESHELAGRALERMWDVPGEVSPLRRALIQGEPSLRTEGFLVRGGVDSRQERLPVLVNTAPFRPVEGGARGAVVVFEDLSGVQAMQEEIRHLDTLAAIGRFASSMAHEIRNPLGGISAGIDYLTRARQLEDDDRQSIEVIQSEIERLDRIIRNLFNVARPTKLQLMASEPVRLAERAVGSLEEWARQEGVEIEVHSSGPVPEFHVDRDLIHQLLINLLKNAVEASSAGQKVEVEISSVHADSDLVDSALPSDIEEGIVIQVQDHGLGIDAEELSNVFEPFYSKKKQGTGLGLFVCHNIAQRHGGQIQVRSRPGEGACFRLCLPQVPALIGGKL